jgi:hypothetical protein
MGSHQLPRCQRHHPADHRMVERTSVTPQLFPGVDCDIYD